VTEKLRSKVNESTYIIVPGDQKGLFKLAVQLRKFYILVIYNTATGYVLLVYLTNI
jgi:membrane-bound lytic murein transglycosylase B